ncbi:hypothetical protein NEDG_01394 [Nematocida displodere]|uniref:Uncharacterized protein n=1 Tax=Nematocida displodere TaxID=1805483 RepID=A0A177ECR9_9MICR|nr:hypothetical protein NEDG_01394 [Nematocida displodere]
MSERRKKDVKRLEQVDSEISLLEKEKSSTFNAMVEIENEQEIKKRVSNKRLTKPIGGSAAPLKIAPGMLKSLNQLMFEMSNLPTEYILAQSNKMVLTGEWFLSILEKEWLEKISTVKKLLDRKMFLEETRRTEFSEIGGARRRLLAQAEAKKSMARQVTKTLHQMSGVPRASTGRPVDAVSLLASEYTPETVKSDSQRRYRYLLSLFSLMKANKSAVRFTIPQSKKSTASVHSSHAACLEKLKAEVGKICTIPELAKYRLSRKNQQEQQKLSSISLHKTQKHGVPIMITESKIEELSIRPKHPESENPENPEH